MKLRYFLILGAIVLFASGEALAQSYVESALIFSRTRPGGSARVQSLGGSQTALGGDYSSAFSNPGGLGMFNRSEFSITPALSFSNVEATYFGTKTEEDGSRFQIPGLAFVFHVPSEKEEGAFVGGSFAITLNRTNDFNRNITYKAENPESSIVEYFIDQANGLVTDAFLEGGDYYNTPTGLAYHNFLIGPASTLDPSFPDDEYFTDVQENFENIQSNPNQREEIELSRAMSQWSISYGANFLDKIFVGGGIGIGTLRYKSQKVFTESYAVDERFSDLRLEEDLDIKGSGINATLGAIVRPVDFAQIGFSYTTPTYYQVSETYQAFMDTHWKNFEYYDGAILNDESAFTDPVVSDYNLTLPSRVNFGVAFISKFGFITGDVELMNPSKTKYSSETDGLDFGLDNDDIKSVYQSVVNYRIGAEFRHDIWRIRAGYGIQGSPYREDVGIDDKITTISGGVGMRLKKFYVDFALIHNKSESLYQPYTFSDRPAPIVGLKNKLTTGMITFGFNY